MGHSLLRFLSDIRSESPLTAEGSSSGRRERRLPRRHFFFEMYISWLPFAPWLSTCETPAHSQPPHGSQRTGPGFETARYLWSLRATASWGGRWSCCRPFCPFSVRLAVTRSPWPTEALWEERSIKQAVNVSSQFGRTWGRSGDKLRKNSGGLGSHRVHNN